MNESAKIGTTRPTAPLTALLEGLVDYAGLFPPAQLSMAAAVAEYATQRRGDHAWMLGRFVVPVGRLDELATAASEHWGQPENGPWPLSVLAGSEPDADRVALETFAAAHGAHATIASLETKATTVDDVARLADAFAGREQYVEIAHGADDLEALMATVATRELRAKIRTGGVTPDAFPTPARVARFLVAAADAGVTVKATAGLHHPLRGEYRLTYAADSPRGTMFGFLNVFLAAAFVREGLRGADVERLLEVRDAAELVFDEDGIRWRGHTLSAEDLRRARQLGACSYGSCSFAEPVEDLHTLGLLTT